MPLTRRDLLASLPLLTWPGVLAGAPAAPGPRVGHVLAYHRGRNAVCLLGGYQGRAPEKEQTWFWNGVHWESQSAPAGGVPFSRTLPGVAYDAAHDRIVYLGGMLISTGKPNGELWFLRDNGRWEVSPGATPGPRDQHAAVYDSQRERVVVYGGQDLRRRLVTEVWELDGEKWRVMTSLGGPGERAHHAMAYDSRRGRTVLVGGLGRIGIYRGETWEWDGRSWLRISAEGPPPLARHRMAYDAARGATVLFGGDTGAGAEGRLAVNNDTWLWNGTTWSKAAPAASPSARMSHALAYDSRRERVVLYGGSSGTQTFGDTWEWDGANWRQVA